MPKTTCKFRIESVEPMGDGETIKLHTEYEDDSPIDEDSRFSQYTPSGHMEFNCQNPTLVGKFHVGDEYYIHLIPCEDDPARGRIISPTPPLNR